MLKKSLIYWLRILAVKQDAEKVLKSVSVLCEFQELSTLQAQVRLGRFCPCPLAKVS